jgi:hypothetical protein
MAVRCYEKAANIPSMSIGKPVLSQLFQDTVNKDVLVKKICQDLEIPEP